MQAVGSVIWAIVLPNITDRKLAYSISLSIGAVGFCMIPFVSDQYMLFIPYVMIGCAWAAMLAMPFAIVTNALEGYGHMGVYLGLFNGTICIPQIVAAACGGWSVAHNRSHLRLLCERQDIAENVVYANVCADSLNLFLNYYPSSTK